MSKELLEIFKKVFDDHFCRETVIVLGYDLAARDGLLTEDENREFVDFLLTHPHKILSMQRMRDAGMATPDVLEKELTEAMGDKPEEIKPGHPDYPVAIGAIKGITPIPEKEEPKEPEEEEPDYDGDHEPEPNDIIIYDDRPCPQCAGTRWNVPAEGEKWSCDSCGWESDELPPTKTKDPEPDDKEEDEGP